jgi:NADH:flavin oxidoreductase / NADH oxidase family
MPISSAERANDVLVRPFSLGSLTVPNRVVMSPMTREFSPDGVPGSDVAQYYARRAAGGVGLIITEGTYVGHDSAGSSARVPRFYGDEALAGWSAVADTVHQAGGKIMPQLWHMGMDRAAGAPPVPDAPRIGPSGIAFSNRRNRSVPEQGERSLPSGQRNALEPPRHPQVRLDAGGRRCQLGFTIAPSRPDTPNITRLQQRNRRVPQKTSSQAWITGSRCAPLTLPSPRGHPTT